jgi:hypothetical protein
MGLVVLALIALGFLINRGLEREPHKDPPENKTCVVKTADAKLFDPYVSAQTLLAKKLFDEGYLATVKCTVFQGTLEPLCEVMMQPKSGGPVVGPIRYVGEFSIEWKTY